MSSLAPTERMRSLRTSARRWTSTGALAPSPTSASSRSRANSLPSIEAASMTARSPGPSRSSRAAISAWIVGGTAIAVSSAALDPSPSPEDRRRRR